MKLIIAGGRNYIFGKSEYNWLDRLPVIVDLVISGGAKGADYCGEIWAKKNNIPIKTFPAQWQRLGKKAGMVRNGDMAKFADALAIFPGGAGTNNMKKQAKQHKLQIFEYGE